MQVGTKPLNAGEPVVNLPVELEVNLMESPMQMGDIGKVVLCSARDCSYNQNTKCVAEAVHVRLHSDHADCNTYTHNQHTGAASTEQRQQQEY